MAAVWSPLNAVVVAALLLVTTSLTSAALPSSVNGTRYKFDTCYGCICEAASRCNRALGCNKGVCGLFQITKPYWIDAGTPTLPGDDPFSPQAFERCTTDAYCALATVHGYMDRYGKDCNGNGNVDCHDLALLHNLGLTCEGQPKTEFIQEFEDCRFKVTLLEGS